MRSTRGFSLLELLAATVLMGLIITVVVAPLTNLFRSTTLSTQRLGITSQAQNVLEYIKGQWKAYPRVLDDTLATSDANYRLDLNRSLRLEGRRRYDSTCYDKTGISDPTGISYTVTVTAVDRSGAIGATQAVTAATNGCASVTVDTSVIPPPMKLITVTVTGPQSKTTTLSAVVARP